MIALLGIGALLLIAYGLSENRRAIQPRVVLAALALQFTIAAVVLYVPLGRSLLSAVSNVVQNLIAYTNVGTEFVFGRLASEEFGFVVAMRVLPVIIFVSAIISILYQMGIMRWVVLLVGGALQRVTGVSRVESLTAAANIFVGMVEAPMIARPFLPSLSRAQFFAVMSGGLASVAGSILLGYASLGIDLNFLLAASFMAAPGGLLMAKMLIPDNPDADPTFEISGDSSDDTRPSSNVIEAAVDGAIAGLRIAAFVSAMLIAFVALVALINGILGWMGGMAGWDSLTLETILGTLFAPLMYLLGIPWEEAAAAGSLVGQKTILNEFLAYLNFVQIREDFSPHSQAVITFALCGFANFTGLAILLGGMGGMIPERKTEAASLGIRVLLVGTLSNLMSAAIASVLLSLGGL